MLFIYVFFLLTLVTIFLFYLTYKRLHFTYTSSNSIIDANLYGHPSPSSCLQANTLRTCTSDSQCSPTKCNLTQSQVSKGVSLTCRPYLNAASACESMESCDTTFCDIKYVKESNTRVCVPKSFCQLPEPIKICNQRNGGQWQLTGISEATGENAGDMSESLYQCICKYPSIAGGDGCELNPDVCYGGDWLYHAQDNCRDQVDEQNCLYKAPMSPTVANISGIANYKQLSPSSPHLRRSCQWLPSPINPTMGTCASRPPDPTTDCLCPPTSYLLIKDQGAMGKQNVPICVKKNKTTCSNEQMCTNFYSNTIFPLTPSQNYMSTLPVVPYLTGRAPPSQFSWSPSACLQPENYFGSTITPTGIYSPTNSFLKNVCDENIGTCVTKQPYKASASLKTKINKICTCTAGGIISKSPTVGTFETCEILCPLVTSGAIDNQMIESINLPYIELFLKQLNIKNKKYCEENPGILESTWVVSPSVTKAQWDWANNSM